MSQAPTREPILRQDYRPPAFLTPEIELDFVLAPEATLVTARQRFVRNPAADEHAGDLILRGEGQELLALSIDGVPLPSARCRIDGDQLTVTEPPAEFTLRSPAASTRRPTPA